MTLVYVSFITFNGSVIHVDPLQVYTPEELQRMHHIPSAGRSHGFKGRKRGRPRGDEPALSALRAAEEHAKKLRTEFGLTGAQVLAIAKYFMT